MNLPNGHTRLTQAVHVRIQPMLDTATVLQKLGTWIGTQPDLHLAVVYGSFAKETQTDSSDLDIALEFSKPLTVTQRIELAAELSAIVEREVDLVDLCVVRGTILEEILTKGKFLKKNTTAYAKLLKTMWFDHEDFYPARKRILQARQKRAFG